MRTVGEVHERIPLLVVLPATGGTSGEMLDRLAPAIPLPSYVALLPGGRPSSSDYLPDFRRFATTMEEPILADAERAKQERSVDPERVYERHARFALAIGRSDDVARIAGITRARDALRGGQVDSELFIYEGAHQLPSDAETLPRALRFLFER